MNLKDVLLEKVSTKKIDYAFYQWYADLQTSKNRKKKKLFITQTACKIITPLSFKSYEDLFEEFKNHPYSDRLSVMEGLHIREEGWANIVWKESMVSDLSKERISELTDITEKNLYKGYIIMRFKSNPKSEVYSSLKVIEFKGVPTTYEVSVAPRQKDLFSWKGKTYPDRVSTKGLLFPKEEDVIRDKINRISKYSK